MTSPDQNSVAGFTSIAGKSAAAPFGYSLRGTCQPRSHAALHLGAATLTPGAAIDLAGTRLLPARNHNDEPMPGHDESPKSWR